MTHKCCVCEKVLESVLPDDMQFQPNDGGEILLSFCYGSGKFDNSLGVTTFKGFICDDCAETMVKNLEPQNYVLRELPKLSIDDLPKGDSYES